MLTLMLLISTALAGDMPEFVAPDPALLAALPAEQREMLLSAQIADNTDPQGEERLLVALMVSQRFGEATSADTPELLPTLADALSADANTRGDALARAGTTQAAPTAAQASSAVAVSSGISVVTAPKTAVLRSAAGRRLPSDWRRLSVQVAPPPPGADAAYGTWLVVGSQGRRADGLDLARVLQLTQHEEVLTARRRRMLVNMAVGAGAGALGVVLSPLLFFAPVLGLVVVGAAIGGLGVGIASPFLWKRQKNELDRWFDRDDLLKRIDAHNLYWSSQVPTRTTSVPPSLPAAPATPPAPPVSSEPPTPAAPQEPPAPKPPR